MPIIIRKGSDQQTKKNIHKNKSESNEVVSDEEKDNKSTMIATDMTDVLDFKVYRITKPTFYDNAVKTTLIGEMFYDDEDDEYLRSLKKKNIINKLSTDEKEPKNIDGIVEVDSKYPGTTTAVATVERIEDCQKVRIRPHPKVVLQRVHKYERTFKSLKSSSVVGHSYEYPSLEETLQWVFMYIQWNENNLAIEFLEFESDIKTFQDDKKSSKPESPRKSKLRSSTEYKLGSASTLPGLESSSGLIQVQHHSGNNNNNSNNNSTKSKSLAIQLEVMKTQGVDSFLRHIETFNHRPSFLNTGIVGSVSKKHQSALPNVLEQSNEESVTTLHHILKSGFQDNLNNNLQQQQISIPAKPNSSKPSSSSASQSRGSNVRRSFSNILSREVSRDDISLMKSVNHSMDQHHHNHEKQPVSSHSSRRTSFAIPLLSASPSKDLYDTDTSNTILPSKHQQNEDKRVTSASAGANSKNASIANQGNITKNIISSSHHNAIPGSQSSKDTINNPKQYSNKSSTFNTTALHNATTATASNGFVSAQMTAETQQTIQEIRETQKRFQKTMGHILRQINNYKNKTDHMQNQITKKISKLEQKTIHVIKDINQFSAYHDTLHDITNGKLDEKEYHRNSEIKEKMKCLDLFFKNHENLNENVHKDLKIISKTSERNLYKSNFTNLLNNKWYINIIIKLKEYMKKTNLTPLCCVKYSIVLKYVLMSGFEFDRKLFYLILEKTVIIHEDHLKSIVHIFLKGLREAIDIDPIEFHAYLESKDIPVNPELLNQVRTYKEQQVLSNSRMYFKKPGSSNDSYSNHSSNNRSISFNHSATIKEHNSDYTNNTNNVIMATSEVIDVLPNHNKQHGGLLAAVSEDM